MSTAKRSRRRPADGRSASPQPDTKRLKVDKSPRVSSQNGLGYLIDENARAGKKLEAKSINGVRPLKTSRVDDSHAVVVMNPADGEEDDDDDDDNRPPLKSRSRKEEVIDVSSDEDSSSLDDEDEDEDESMGKPKALNNMTNGHVSESDEESKGATNAGAQSVTALQPGDADVMDEDGPLDEPTFGDLLKSQHPEPIDIDGDGAPRAIVPTNPGLAPPSASSLGTVLTQALKTNDKDLLESCFRLTDLPSIRSTIQRLPSPFVATLLQRLAERIHKRPGRTGSLMVWIQWSLVAHGAYLANNPSTMREIKGLIAVVRERANGLQPLLSLKGKLDLLSAQLELRRNLERSSGQFGDEDDVEAVRWVEGEDAEARSPEYYESDEGEATTKPTQRVTGKKTMPVANGIHDTMVNGVDEESSDDDDVYAEDGEDLLDIEAEEESDDEVEKDSDEEAESVDESSEEDEASEDDDDSEIVVQPPKHNTLSRKR